MLKLEFPQDDEATGDLWVLERKKYNSAVKTAFTRYAATHAHTRWTNLVPQRTLPDAQRPASSDASIRAVTQYPKGNAHVQRGVGDQDLVLRIVCFKPCQHDTFSCILRGANMGNMARLG